MFIISILEIGMPSWYEPQLWIIECHDMVDCYKASRSTWQYSGLKLTFTKLPECWWNVRTPVYMFSLSFKIPHSARVNTFPAKIKETQSTMMLRALCKCLHIRRANNSVVFENSRTLKMIYISFIMNEKNFNTLESLSYALYVKRQTPGKEKFYVFRQ